MIFCSVEDKDIRTSRSPLLHSMNLFLTFYSKGCNPQLVIKVLGLEQVGIEKLLGSLKTPER